MFVLCPLLSPYRRHRARALRYPCKTNWIDFTYWCPSYHLNSWRKPALMKKPLAQIPLESLSLTWKCWKENDLGINLLIQPITYQTLIGNKYTGSLPLLSKNLLWNENTWNHTRNKKKNHISLCNFFSTKYMFTFVQTNKKIHKNKKLEKKANRFTHWDKTCFVDMRKTQKSN